MSQLKIASFFAGIGGFDLAFERAGFETVMQCEINSFCNEVLEKNWPDVKRFKDIRTLKPEEIPDSDVWCAGFPCQDVSLARGAKGRDGLKGKNSGLFFAFLELVRAKRPDTILLENVVGLLNSHNGQDFKTILEELGNLGYGVAWRILNSRYFGAPQSRSRVFICCSLANNKLPLSALFEQEKSVKPVAPRNGFLQADFCSKTGAVVPRVAYCLAATSGRHTGTDWSRTYVSYKSAVRRLTPRECEGLQGFPFGWTNCGPHELDDEDTPRYHALGNAVAVPVIEWIANRIRASLKNKLEMYSARDFKEFIKGYGDFQSSNVRIFKLSKPQKSDLSSPGKIKWQSSGFYFNNQCIDVKAFEAPVNVSETPLLSVIEDVIPADKYFISPNAAQGILRRVQSQNRSLFAPMDSALKLMTKQAL